MIRSAVAMVTMKSTVDRGMTLSSVEMEMTIYGVMITMIFSVMLQETMI